ncbi:MAG: hypothetical protein UZ22_OP11002000374 [Microgenomates bacterium OLB23]|nr:MAG: hypothetical protein UZ22_OP11002000374 [Microgenomates bacterium OLB23]
MPRNAKQNRLYSQEFRLRNQEFGRLRDVALLKGFYLDWSIYDFKSEQFENLMPEWKKHYENPFISVLGYGVFALVLAGVFNYN